MSDETDKKYADAKFGTPAAEPLTPGMEQLFELSVNDAQTLYSALTRAIDAAAAQTGRSPLCVDHGDCACPAEMREALILRHRTAGSSRDDGYKAIRELLRLENTYGVNDAPWFTVDESGAAAADDLLNRLSQARSYERERHSSYAYAAADLAAQGTDKTTVSALLRAAIRGTARAVAFTTALSRLENHLDTYGLTPLIAKLRAERMRSAQEKAMGSFAKMLGGGTVLDLLKGPNPGEAN